MKVIRVKDWKQKWNITHINGNCPTAEWNYRRFPTIFKKRRTVRRLLAVMERAEEDFYSRTQEARQTNAIKNLPEYRQRPLYVFERVNRMLQQAYLPRIEPWQRDRYARLTGEIFAILREFPEDTMNQRLNENYLLGYELQRNAFFTKKETVKTEE